MCKTERKPCTNCKKTSHASRQPSDIQAAVHTHYGLLRACYEDALSRDATAEGIVTTRFVITPTGEVELACFEQFGLKDRDAAACILDVFSAMRFTSAPGKVTVVYPIRFEPWMKADADLK